jgi:CRP-like cAMP-binding protein
MLGHESTKLSRFFIAMDSSSRSPPLANFENAEVGWNISMPRTIFPLALRKRLESVAKALRKPKDAVLFRAGQPCRGAFLIRSGKVELSLEGASHLYPTRIVGAGNVVGLPAAFSGEPYSLTAKTKSACRLDFIPRGELLDLLRRNPRASLDIVRMLSEEIFQMRNVAKRSLQTINRHLSRR